MEVESFLSTLSPSNGYSAQTRTAYESDLKLFAEFLLAQSIRRLTQVNTKVITEFIDHMSGRPNPRFKRTGSVDASIRRRLSAISSYFDYTRATTNPKLINPVKSLPRRKWQMNCDPKPVDRLTLDLLIPGVSSLRDRFLFSLFLSSGLRVSEVWQLNRTSITIKQVEEKGTKRILGSGEVLGKGNKSRTFYVDRKTLVLYSHYLATRTDANPALFLSKRKQRMSVRAMQFALQAWCKRLGAPHLNIHRLRHSYATRLAEGEISSIVLKELMGHENFATTMRYIKLSDKKLARGYFSAMEYQQG